MSRSRKFAVPLLPTTLALGALALFTWASPAGAGEAKPATVSSHTSRSSEDPPPPNTSGSAHGSQNDGSTTYDTNWFFDADAGDSNAIWYRVTGACIEGTGNVTTDDAGSISRLTQSAWGLESATFSAPVSGDERAEITVTNDIQLAAIWTIAANGMNTMVLDGVAIDFMGGMHPLTVVKNVDGGVTVTNTGTQSDSSASEQSFTTAGGTQGTGVTDVSSDKQADVTTSSVSTTATSGDSQAGSSNVEARVTGTFNASSVTVFISSREKMDLGARALVEDVDTMVNVSKFDTLNVVSASYVITSPNGGFPQTPGGETSGGGPTTPSGAPPTSGPTTPSGAPPAGGPTTPGGSGSGATDDGSAPPAPGGGSVTPTGPLPTGPIPGPGPNTAPITPPNGKEPGVPTPGGTGGTGGTVPPAGGCVPPSGWDSDWPYGSLPEFGSGFPDCGGSEQTAREDGTVGAVAR